MNLLAEKAREFSRTGVFTYSDALIWLGGTRNSVRCKLHALLCRSYVKGRDWFDLVWYASVKARFNGPLLSAALDQQGPWAGTHVQADEEWVRRELHSIIDRMDWNAAREDVRRFVYSADRPSLDLWTCDFFASLVDRLLA